MTGIPARKLALLIGLLCLGAVLAESACKPGPVPEEVRKKAFIPELRRENFAGRGIRIVKALEINKEFTRYLIDYDSRGLRISGMMNVPRGEGPFPAVVLNHGFYGSRPFSVGLGFKEAADIFARNGYVAVGSDYRNNGSSDRGDNLFQHLGYLQDVLALVEAVRSVPEVDRDRIGMWGYSLGGWLALKACVIDPGIGAVALFGSMSVDDRDNYAFLKGMHPEALKPVDERIGSPADNPEAYNRMSPITYIDAMPAYVIIHHGDKDDAAPAAWSERLRDALRDKGKTVEYHTYPGEGHVLKGRPWEISMRRTVDFFDAHLKNGKRESH